MYVQYTRVVCVFMVVVTIHECVLNSHIHACTHRRACTHTHTHTHTHTQHICTLMSMYMKCISTLPYSVRNKEQVLDGQMS